MWYGDGPGSPRTAPAEVLALAGFEPAASHRVTLGWTLEHHGWLDDPGLTGRALIAGYALRRAVGDGKLTPLAVRLSAVESMIATQRPDVAIVAGVRRGDQLAFGTAVGWADALVRIAARVVVEVDEDGVDLGAPLIEGNVVATVSRAQAPIEVAPVASARAAEAVDLSIGERVCSLLPDGATLQFGPGGIGEGIVRALERPVRILSGIVTDAVADLDARGLLAAPAIAGYAWGGDPVRQLAANGMLQLAPASVTHDLTRLSAIPCFVACNTALQVGLDGSVNIERVDGRVITSIGGHSDFCVGSSRSPRGMSIIALRSTYATGKSTIVPVVEVVSTQRSDVDVVVTEHGIADLRGAGDAERADRLIAIAAPEHRAGLELAARRGRD
jgi:acyl-CoA hydrolase